MRVIKGREGSFCRDCNARANNIRDFSLNVPLARYIIVSIYQSSLPNSGFFAKYLTRILILSDPRKRGNNIENLSLGSFENSLFLYLISFTALFLDHSYLVTHF